MQGAISLKVYNFLLVAWLWFSGACVLAPHKAHHELYTTSCPLGTYHHRVCTSNTDAQDYRRFTGEKGHLHHEMKQLSMQTKAKNIHFRAKPKTEALLFHITNLNSRQQAQYDL